MKRFLTLFLLACGYLGLSQTAYVQLNFSVLDQNNLPALGKVFRIYDSASATQVNALGHRVVGSSGFISDTLESSYSSGWFRIVYTDCNIQPVVISIPYNASNGWNHPVYTNPITFPCYDGCNNFRRLLRVERTSYNQMIFEANVGQGGSASWSFTDGYSNTNSFSRTFNSSPSGISYTVSEGTCTYTDDVMLSPKVWLEIDSNSSGQGSLNLINATWGSAQFASNSVYIWDFGDGSPVDSTLGAYPVHTYAQPGTFTLLMVYREYNNSGVMSYTDYRRITFNIDANGNLYKNGFTVNVIDPASVGIDEESISPITLYPQPANGIVNLQTDAVIDGVEVYNMAGIKVLSKTEGDMSLVDLTGQPSGVYMLNIKTEGRTVVEKCIIR